MLTQDRLKELLHYDPETGIWTWIMSWLGLFSSKEEAKDVYCEAKKKYHGEFIRGVS